MSMLKAFGAGVLVVFLSVSATTPVFAARLDLVLSVQNDRFRARPGERLGVRVKVSNRGFRSSAKENSNSRRMRSVMVALVISRDRRVPIPLSMRSSSHFREDGVLRNGVFRAGSKLASSGRWQTHRMVKIPRDIPPGRWWMCGVVDPLDHHKERNERNNVACKELLVAAADKKRTARRDSQDAASSSRRSSRRRVVEDLLGRIFRDPQSGTAGAASKPRKKPATRGRVGNRAPELSSCPGNGRADLEAAAVKAPTRLRKGEPHRFNILVLNEGTGPAPGYDGRCGYRVHVLLSKTNGVELPRRGRYAPGVYVVRQIDRTPPLAADERMRIPREQRNLRVGGVPPGRYWLCLTVDPYNGVPESDETNNARCEYQVTVE